MDIRDRLKGTMCIPVKSELALGGGVWTLISEWLFGVVCSTFSVIMMSQHLVLVNRRYFVPSNSLPKQPLLVSIQRAE